MNNQKIVVSSTPWCLLATCVLGVLKLAGPLASVSWWAITSPLWLPLAIIGATVGVIGAFILVLGLLAVITGRNNRR